MYTNMCLLFIQTLACTIGNSEFNFNFASIAHIAPFDFTNEFSKRIFFESVLDVASRSKFFTNTIHMNCF